MSLLDRFIETPFAVALGWTVFHSLWQGAIPAALLATMMFAVRSARIRYASACMAMLVVLAAFGLTLLHELPESAAAPVSHPLTIALVNAQTKMQAAGTWQSGLTGIVPWLAPLWIAGVIVFYLRQAAGFVLVHRLRRRGVCCAPERWQLDLDRLRERVRLARPVVLLVSSLAEVPVVIGHFRPVILMPLALLANLPAGQVEAILLHELAHVRRRDYLVNALQRLVESLLFYHPAVWWVSRVIRSERENCCDDVVVSVRGDAHEYALALAALEENRLSGREPAIAASGGNLVTRIRRLLYPKGSNSAWIPVLAAVILISITAVTLGAWQAGQPRSVDNAAGANSPYSAWLNQDVVYIINDDERAAFQQLTTVNERQKFIEQFWARRSPAGSPQNSFRDEHYRRIDYANRKYQMASGTPGWRTDRGRMYILYGPPDEMESHPPRGATPYKFEVWLYRNMDGIGKNVTLAFFDRTGRGDFLLAPGNGR